MKKRLPEVHWNTLQGKSGTRQIGDTLPVMKEYEENGRIIKVYPSARSVDLVGEHNNSAKSGNASFKNVWYPAG